MKPKLIKTLQSIFFSNGVKCDSEQFLIEDIESLISQSVEQERQTLKKLVLKLIKSHIDGDNSAFKQTALAVADELRLNGKYELYMYILAQYQLVNTFEITD